MAYATAEAAVSVLAKWDETRLADLNRVAAAAGSDPVVWLRYKLGALAIDAGRFDLVSELVAVSR